MVDIKKYTYFVFRNFFFPDNRAVCVTMWTKCATASRTCHRWQIIRRMRTACWTTKDTDRHSEYVPLVCPRPPKVTRTLPVLFMVYFMELLASPIIRRRIRRRSKAVVAKFQYESDPNVKDRRQTMKHSNSACSDFTVWFSGVTPCSPVNISPYIVGTLALPSG